MIRGFIISLWLIVTTAACGRSATPRFFTLDAQPGASQSAAPAVVEVRRPSVPGYLDRPVIVRRDEDYRLVLADADRWGEPLSDMIGRVLTENLAQRLPRSEVFAESGTLTVEPDARVELDLQRFELGADGDVVLDAQVSVRRVGSVDGSSLRRVTLRQTPEGDDTGQVAEAMTALLAQLADQVAQRLSNLP